MAKAKKEILSEDTRKTTKKEREGFQSAVAAMAEEELCKLRNGFDADSMGFYGEEGI